MCRTRLRSRAKASNLRQAHTTHEGEADHDHKPPFAHAVQRIDMLALGSSWKELGAVKGAVDGRTSDTAEGTSCQRATE
jgi:hypothetical protein